MISDLSIMLAAVAFLGTPILLIVMFLPTFLELKKPKDAGPRLIMNDFLGVSTQFGSVSLLRNLEEDHEYAVGLVPAISNIIGFLPKLDA